VPVRSAAIVAGASVAGSFVDVFTCPAGQTVIVKDLRMAGGGVAMSRAVFYVRSGPTAVFIVDQAMGATEVITRADMFVVLEPGDDLGVFSAGGTFAFIACGALLDGVA
jgi:hypothetical protein